MAQKWCRKKLYRKPLKKPWKNHHPLCKNNSYNKSLPLCPWLKVTWEGSLWVSCLISCVWRNQLSFRMMLQTQNLVIASGKWTVRLEEDLKTPSQKRQERITIRNESEPLNHLSVHVRESLTAKETLNNKIKKTNLYYASC